MNGQKHFPTAEDLFDAVEKNEISMVQNLLENGCDINARDEGKSTPVMRAALRGYDDLLSVLIRLKADLNLSDRIGKTALHYAAQEHHEETVQKLLDAGAFVNCQDAHGNSPLSNAVFYSQGRGGVIKILRQYGADDNLPNNHGVTPLALAQSISNYDVIQYFESKSGKP
jgi:uncharacterized protein